MEKEFWKPVKGYEGLYEVSSLGRVKSLSRCREGGRYKCMMEYKERVLKQSKNSQGYSKIDLCREGTIKTYRVHRIIAETFLGDSALEVNHIDGDKCNNNVTNLEYVTSSENHKHAFKLGLYNKKGERHHLAVLTDEIVKNIRANKFKLTAEELSVCFGVCKATIYNILRRKSWAHI